MRDIYLSLFLRGQALLSALKSDEGQDLVEYALVCALVAFGAIAGMQGLASSINTAFGQVGTTLTSNT